MKSGWLHFFFFLLLLSAAPAAAQLGFDLDIKKPEPYENRELRAEKSGNKKFNAPRRVFQNTFTHYNYFFNANNKLNEVLRRAKELHRDDYSSLLSFYNYAIKNTSENKSELDSIIYKSKTGILLHDLRNDWIDNMYMLWGQAYFLQGEYDSAYQIFQFVNYAFADKEKDGYYKYIGSRMDGNAADKITSSEKVKFPKSVIADIPSRNEALLWQVRSMIARDAYTEAGSLLNALRNDPGFPERLVKTREEIQALWFYNQSRWDSAAFHLVEALDAAPTAQERARWEYLAAQLFEKAMLMDKAMPLYQKSIAHTVDPVLELYARLSLIRINKEGGENYIDENIAALIKMAKRDKYRDYRDAIYYAAGEMELARDNFPKAQEYFLKAGKYRSEEGAISSKGYQQLADLFFKQGDYEKAAQFYDSVQTDAFTEEQMQALDARKSLIAPLVTHIQIVQRQDSLQKLAALPQKEREDYVRKLARQLRRQRGLSEETAANESNPAAANISSRSTEAADLFGGRTKGEWYFYNANTRTQGLAGFKRLWGNRPNVDNWRRYADAVATLNDQSPDATRDPDAGVMIDENKLFTYDALLANLPLKEEQLNASNDSIANAWAAMGGMYINQFENYPLAIKTYEALRERFPEFAGMEEALFNLYFAYTKTGDKEKAAAIKKLLTEKYDDGAYVKRLSTGKDPAADTFDGKATKDYEAIYDMFIEGRFDEATAAKRVADSAYGTSAWSPQLLYIEAVYHIKKGDDNAAKEALNKIMQATGEGPMAEKATTLLDVLERRHEIEEELRNLQIEMPKEDTVIKEERTLRAQRATPVMRDTATAKEPTVAQPAIVKKEILTIEPKPLPQRLKEYMYDPEAEQVALIILNKVDVVFGNETRNAFARYNRERYSSRNLTIENIELNDSLKLVAISGFAGIQEVVEYVQQARPRAATEIIPWLKQDKYHFSMISKPNMELLLERKDVKAYESFLEKSLPVKL